MRTEDVVESSVPKNFWLRSLLCLFLGAGVTAAEDFGTARLLPIGGTVRKSQSDVELDQKASEMPKDAKCTYTVEATNGVYSQTVKLFPGVNRITTKTADGTSETLAKLDVQKPNLRVELSWIGQNTEYTLCVNDRSCNNSSDSGKEAVSIHQADAGLYRIHVRYTPPVFSRGGGALIPMTDWFLNIGNRSVMMYSNTVDSSYTFLHGYHCEEYFYSWPEDIVAKPTAWQDDSIVIWCRADWDGMDFLIIELLPFPFSKTICFDGLYYTRAGADAPFVTIYGHTGARNKNGLTESLAVNATTASVAQKVWYAHSSGSFSVNKGSIVPLAGALQQATICVYVNDRLIHTETLHVGIVSSAEERVWNIGTVALHSGSGVGGYAVDGRRLDVTEQGAFAGVSPRTDFEVTVLSGANGTAPICLGVGDAAQFTASGTLNTGSDCEQADMPIIECFTNSNDAVGAVDGLGVFVAKAPGHTRVSCAGYSGDPIDVYVVDVDIAMDGDRDGGISFDGTNDTSYVFWVNDDCDLEHYNEDMWQEDDASPTDSGGHRDCDDNAIGNKTTPGEGACLRDLEDFTRLHIRINAPDAEQNGVTFALRLENVADGDPAVNIFQAVTNSTAYLTDTNTATDQIQNPRLWTVANGGSDQSLDMLTLKTDGTVSTFLLEGKSAGTADLTLVAKKDGAEICRKSVRLELHPITWFYDIYTNGVVSGDRWTVEVEKSATHSQIASYQPKTSERLLFVHGWNMEGWEKKRWTETTFKRLWWQGYQGSVALFDWPTLADDDADIWPPSKWWDLITETRHFDNSEFIAWQSSDALANLMAGLNTDGQLRVLAHSMGNVVTAEAFRKYSGPRIKAYIAAQAAISAQYYDGATSVQDPALHFNGADTPDVMGHFATNGMAHADSYMSGVLSAKTSKTINCVNPDDYALDRWSYNNNLKPDGAVPYHFQYSGSLTNYTEGADEFYRQSVIYVSPHQTQHLMDETERYRIFAYCAESRSRALGQLVNGITGFTSWNFKEQMGYDDQHYSHSREFRSNVAAERVFWLKVRNE